VKRKYQQMKRVYMQSKKGLGRLGFIISMTAFVLTYLAKSVYVSEPHTWYDITGRLDILLLGFAFVFSLVNMYIKSSLMFFQVILGTGNVIWTLCTILFPFLVIILSLFLNPLLYLVPFITIIIVHLYAHFKPARTAH
jgi:hypothetical protein